MIGRGIVWVVVGLTVAAPLLAQEGKEEAVAGIREAIEADFRARNGLSFVAFDCDLGPEVVTTRRFSCEAQDEEGDRFTYHLKVDDDGGATVALSTQDADQLPPDSRVLLETPCRAFLARYDAEDWAGLHAGLDPALREVVSEDGARERLAPVRRAMGKIESAELELYGSRPNGRNELEYALVGEGGEGTFRCGVGLGDDGESARIIAFLVTARAGSKLQLEMLEEVGRKKVESLIGRPIAALDAPLDHLVHQGDVVEGTARLAGGEEIPVRVEYRGDPNDFEPVDFSFQLLDAPFLVGRYFRSQGREVVSVDCPQRVAPDGGMLACEVVVDGGERLAVTVARHGGDHRILSVEPTTPGS